MQTHLSQELHHCVLDLIIRDQLLTDVCQVCAERSLIDLARDWPVGWSVLLVICWLDVMKLR